MKNIEYKIHPIYKNLKCGTDGSIFSLILNRRLKGHIDRYGYKFVYHSKKQLRIHRLIAQAFLGISDLTIDHLNMIKTDNRVSNLEYVTNEENIKRSFRSNPYRKTNGLVEELNPNVKIKREDVIAIRELGVAGLSSSAISKMYPISRQQISRILSKKSWPNV